MANIYIPTTGPEDWRSLLADPEKHWKPGYSAMAAALSWEAAENLPQEIEDLFGEDARVLLAIPEHKVALPGGRRESQCDIFALVATGEDICAMAVEAKVNETFGPTLGEWRKNASPGKEKRLAYILELLGLGVSPPDHLRYQLFHRTAAAILEAQRFKASRAAMIVQSFSKEDRWYEDFEAFAANLGVSVARGKVTSLSLPSGMVLILGWASCGHV